MRNIISVENADGHSMDIFFDPESPYTNLKWSNANGKVMEIRVADFSVDTIRELGKATSAMKRFSPCREGTIGMVVSKWGKHLYFRLHFNGLNNDKNEYKIESKILESMCQFIDNHVFGFMVNTIDGSDKMYVIVDREKNFHFSIRDKRLFTSDRAYARKLSSGALKVRIYVPNILGYDNAELDRTTGEKACLSFWDKSNPSENVVCEITEDVAVVKLMDFIRVNSFVAENRSLGEGI